MTRFILVAAVTALLTAQVGARSTAAAEVSSNNSTQAVDNAQKEEKVYIPKDLDDCFAELKKMLSKEDIEKMKTGTEDQMIRYHHGLGMWLRNNWGLWRGSRLSKWFNDKGILHPDDMSGIILDSFWRHLNNKPIKLDEQVERYQDYWRKAREKRMLQEKGATSR